MLSLAKDFQTGRHFLFSLQGFPFKTIHFFYFVNVTAPSESRVAGWQVKFIVTSWYILQTQDTRLDDTYRRIITWGSHVSVNGYDRTECGCKRRAAAREVLKVFAEELLRSHSSRSHKYKQAVKYPGYMSEPLRFVVKSCIVLVSGKALGVDRSAIEFFEAPTTAHAADTEVSLEPQPPRR